MSYTKYQVAELIFATWRDAVLGGVCCDNISPTDELDYLKENIQKEYDLTNEDIKKIFDDNNYPFYWDIEEDEVKNCEDEEEEEEEEEEESDYDEEDDWKYLCPNLHWGGQYGCDLCCNCKDTENEEMKKEWLKPNGKYCYKLHKKWLEEKRKKNEDDEDEDEDEEEDEWCECCFCNVELTNKPSAMAGDYCVCINCYNEWKKKNEDDD